VAALDVGPTDTTVPRGPACYAGIGAVLANEVPGGEDAGCYIVQTGLRDSSSEMGVSKIPGSDVVM
jgi:hypothetical protein